MQMNAPPRGPFSGEQLAKAIGVPPERIEDLRAAALLDLDGDGVFDDYDLLVPGSFECTMAIFPRRTSCAGSARTRQRIPS